jgi:hypothetical protein
MLGRNRPDRVFNVVAHIGTYALAALGRRAARIARYEWAVFWVSCPSESPSTSPRPRFKHLQRNRRIDTDQDLGGNYPHIARRPVLGHG